jgi:hypothetical protein
MAAREAARDGRRLVFVTLTQRGDGAESWDGAIDRLMGAWRVLTGTSWWQRTVGGGYWRRETHRTEAGFPHPHLHAVVELAAGEQREPFLRAVSARTGRRASARGERSIVTGGQTLLESAGWDAELTAAWVGHTADQRDGGGAEPWGVHLRAVEGSHEQPLGSAVAELAKYLTKPHKTSHLDGGQLRDLGALALAESGRVGCGWFGGWRARRREVQAAALRTLAVAPYREAPQPPPVPHDRLTGEVVLIARPLEVEKALRAAAEPGSPPLLADVARWWHWHAERLACEREARARTEARAGLGADCAFLVGVDRVGITDAVNPSQ